jgi:anti-sigma regulatory factor (Ser/Thr protein kinase)
MNPCEVVIRNRRAEFSRVVDVVDRFAAEHRLPADVVADIQIALDEILTNIVSYAYPDNAEHRISVGLRLTGNVLEAAIEDDGAPFNPLKIQTPNRSTPLKERRIGGIGLHFVKNLMHEITYDRIGDRNRLVLRRHLTS